MVGHHNAIPMAPLNQWSSVQRVVAVMSGKGGVGKSSVTALTAVELRRRGLQVGILDGDITGPSIPRLFGLERETMKQNELGLLPVISKLGIQVSSINFLLANETDPVIWRGPLIGNMIKQFFSEVVWNDVDVLLVDLPPGTADAPLSVLQSIPVDSVLIVSSPQDMAVMVVQKAIEMVRMMDKQIAGLVENMSGVICPHCGERFDIFGKSQGEELAGKVQIPWLGALPLDPLLASQESSIENYVSPVPGVIEKMAAAAAG